jgi:type IX secretion system PorP/SprF family membrane protein
MWNSKKCKGLKFPLVILFLFALLSSAKAQQDPMFTQYMHNPMSINPAYAGSRETVNAVMMNRQQWVGIEGAPNTMTLSVNSPFMDEKVGIGLSLIYDRIEPTRQLGVYTDYAYHLKVTDKVKFAFGLKGGFNMYDVNTLKLKGSQYENDPTVERMYLPNFGIGSYLYSDRFYLGLSVPKMLQNSLSDNENTLMNKEVRHYFFTGGYVFDIAENVRFKPSFIFRMVSGAPLSSEISGAVLLHDRLWLGTMYRHRDALGGMVKFDITSQLGMGYSYDSSLSRLGNYNKGTHEVYVSYDFTYKNKKSSPRFF